MNFFMTISASHCPSWMSSMSLCPARMFGFLLMSATAMIATGPSSGAVNLDPDIGNIPPESDLGRFAKSRYYFYWDFEMLN